jgi:hypothetical protein
MHTHTAPPPPSKPAEETLAISSKGEGLKERKEAYIREIRHAERTSST